MPLFEDPEMSMPMPARFALIASICMVSSVAFAVSYFVPPTSRYIESCRHAAATPYPGEVKVASAREAAGATQIHLYIEARDGRETVVVCDGPTGRIVRAIAIDAP